mmetsp:Transcript_55915/g.111099  ORF Transcript_55915/g.111099 Transcript_55915/m.111099 type:complete len:269 (-) Transcript_55915:255-1061(-)
MSQEDVAITVKNTFIDVTEPMVHSRGRPSSVPPCARLCGSGGESPTQEKEEMLSQQRPIVRSLTSVSTEDEISTEAESKGEEDVCTEAGTNDDYDTPTSQPQTSFPKVQHSHLSSAARPWTPSLVNAWRGPRNFLSQVEHIMGTVVKALDCHPAIVSAEASKATRYGWSLFVHMRSHDLHRREVVLTQVKEGIIAGAAASQTAYVLGYKARPFATSPVGFATQLVEVPSPDSACWGLLERGCCNFGPACAWQHPPCQVTVNVMVLVAD